MKKLTCALIGFGGIGHHHASRYAHCKNVRLVAICDIDPEKLASVESETNLGASGKLDLAKVRKYTSYEEFAKVEKGRVDMVDLCVPTYEHARLACRAMRDGFHVLSEKPMALTLEQCDKLIETAAETGRTHMVAQCIRFSPIYEELRAIVGDKRFGKLRRLSMRRLGGFPWSQWYHDYRKCGGAVLDLQLHDLDFLVSLLGKPSQLRTEGLRGPSGGWDETFTRLRFGSGANAPLVTTEGSWLRGGFMASFEAVFEHGYVEYSDWKLKIFDAARKPIAHKVKDEDMYGIEIDYFADCVRRGVQPERCLPESTRLSVRLALLQMQSAKSGGKWVRC